MSGRQSIIIKFNYKNLQRTMCFPEVTHRMLTENVLNTFAVRLYTAAMVNEYGKSKFNDSPQ